VPVSPLPASLPARFHELLFCVQAKWATDFISDTPEHGDKNAAVLTDERGDRAVMTNATRCSMSLALPSQEHICDVHIEQPLVRSGQYMKKMSVSSSPNKSRKVTEPTAPSNEYSFETSPPGGSARRCCATHSMCRRNSISASSAVRAWRYSELSFGWCAFAFAARSFAGWRVLRRIVGLYPQSVEPNRVSAV